MTGESEQMQPETPVGRRGAFRGTLFINPHSGSFPATEYEALRQSAAEAAIDVVEIREGIDCRKMIGERRSRGQRLFIAAGGDGTIHHVLQGLVGTDAVLGILPLGTFNHFARDVGIPLDWRAALEIALNGRTEQIDTGVANGRYFINNLMLGLYPKLVEYRERHRKVVSKWRAYMKAGRMALHQFPHISVIVESQHYMEAIRTQIFAIAVNPYDFSGPRVLGTKSDLDQGVLSLYWLPYMTRLRFVRTVGRYLRGKIDTVEGFRRMNVTQVKINSRERSVRVGMDGELIDLETPLRVSVVPSSLLVRLP